MIINTEYNIGQWVFYRSADHTAPYERRFRTGYGKIESMGVGIGADGYCVFYYTLLDAAGNNCTAFISDQGKCGTFGRESLSTEYKVWTI